MTPDEILAQYGPREAMEYDVVVVGAGPAGLATAIRLKQLAAERAARRSRWSCSRRARSPARTSCRGAVMDPRALTELLPDWKELGAPLNQPVTARPLPVPDRDRRDGARPTSCCPTASRTTATTSSASATWCAGWRSRPRRWASRSSPASRPPRCSTTTTARSRAWPPATWASARTASRPTSFQLGMELHAQVHGLRRRRARPPRQAADRAASSSTPAATRRATASASRSCGRSTRRRHKPGLVVHTAGWPLRRDTYGGSLPLPPRRQQGRRSASSSASTTPTPT